MPACPVCSYDNPIEAVQCANCGTVLRPDAVAAPPAVVPPAPRDGRAPAPVSPPVPSAVGAQPVRRIETRPPAVAHQDPEQAGHPSKRGVELTLDSTQLEVAPGASVVTTATVTNLGNEVERFQVQVGGPAGSFATAVPGDLRVMPGKKASAVLTFAPHRVPEQRSGPHPLQVVARSTVNPDVVARQTGTVDVGAFAEVRAELLPEATKGRRPGTQTVQVANGGNEPTTVSLALRDKDKELTFSPSVFDVRLAPGEHREEDFTVVGPVPWFGRTQSYPFTAEGSAPGVVQPIRLDGTRRQLPRFPWWVPTVALALVGVAIAIYALIPHKQLVVPTLTGVTEAAAVEQLKDRGYKPAVLYEGHATTPSGAVIRSEPAAGTALDKDEVVNLVVSQGPCGGKCKTLMPNVLGLQLADAKQVLADEKLTPKVEEQFNAEPAGQVFFSNPDAKEEVKGDRPVLLRVSKGPQPSPSSSPSSSSAASPSSSGGESASTSPPTEGGGDGRITMPDLSGKVAQAALSALVALKLDDAVTQEPRRTGNADPGEVLSTVPAAGADIAIGDDVVLVVAEAPIDLVALAAGATWTDGLGVPYDYQPDVEDVTQPGVGNEFSTTGDGTPVLVVEPAPMTSMIGTFTLPEPPIDGDRLLGVVRIGDAAFQSVAVTLGGEELPVELGDADDAGRQSLTAELPETASTELVLTVTSTGEAADSEITFVDLRIAAE